MRERGLGPEKERNERKGCYTFLGVTKQIRNVTKIEAVRYGEGEERGEKYHGDRHEPVSPRTILRDGPKGSSRGYSRGGVKNYKGDDPELFVEKKGEAQNKKSLIGGATISSGKKTTVKESCCGTG